MQIWSFTFKLCSADHSLWRWGMILLKGREGTFTCLRCGGRSGKEQQWGRGSLLRLCSAEWVTGLWTFLRNERVMAACKCTGLEQSPIPMSVGECFQSWAWLLWQLRLYNSDLHSSLPALHGMSPMPDKGHSKLIRYGSNKIFLKYLQNLLRIFAKWPSQVMPDS